MTLTQQSFKTIFYIVLGLCILTIILSATSFDFVEVDTAISWTMKYFALPILLIMIPTCYFIYLKFIIQHETKKYKSKVWTNLRTTFRIFILTIAMTGIFIGTTLSLIILTNAYLGDSKQINLNAKNCRLLYYKKQRADEISYKNPRRSNRQNCRASG